MDGWISGIRVNFLAIGVSKKEGFPAMTSPDTEFIHITEGQMSEGEPPSGSGRTGTGAFPSEVPILGLSDIVIFPGMVAPLLVDSAASVRLIDDVVGGDRFVGLVLQKNPELDNPKPEDLHPHGCLARVLKMLKFPDATVRILVEGLRRFRVRRYLATDPYLRARVGLMPDVLEDTLELTALARNAQHQFEQVIQLSPAMGDRVKVAALNLEDPGRLADLVAVNLNLQLEERQALLEVPSVRDRLQQLQPLLVREIEVLTLGSKIQQEVASAISKNQKDFYLREQIRALQRELGETDPAAAELAELREGLADQKLPDVVRAVAEKEMQRLEQTPPSVPEYTVIRNYLDWLLRLPWSRETEDNFDLESAARILDEHHHGLEKVKERLLEFLSVIKLRKEVKGPILCLVGPPGTGKTSLGRSLAQALGRRFTRIALGGMRDEAEIRGHRRTYVGAMPGRLVQSLRRVESRNPVILLDEIDKVGSDVRGDPSSALLEVLDPEQNVEFNDYYLDIPFDLSRVLFITTANWLDPIHPALRDRLEVIELPSYTVEEKRQIARKHLLPRQLAAHGLKRSQVRFKSGAMTRLIQEYTQEAGVRQLDREIAGILRKAARRLARRRTPKTPMVVEPETLTELLGPARFLHEGAEGITGPGIALGLAWTPVGGQLLYLEAARMPGKGRLILTGSLGEVMKESAQTALSLLRSRAGGLGLGEKDFESIDVHVHVPAGATPKDGPSAGVALFAALASLFTGRKVRSGVAMTGEISLRGRVLPVGGVKEKVMAAARAGVKTVLLPEANRKEWPEIPAEVRKQVRVRYLKDVTPVFSWVLEK